ncbi:MAG: hypothetical protein ACYC8T_26500 [Myxococcaceae bacterium]
MAASVTIVTAARVAKMTRTTLQPRKRHFDGCGWGTGIAPIAGLHGGAGGFGPARCAGNGGPACTPGVD